MAKIEIELAEDVLERARRSAQAGHVSLEAWLAQAIGRTASSAPDTVLGLFADIPEIMDAITEDAMTARETRPLRTTQGETLDKTLLDTDTFSEVLNNKDVHVAARASAYHAAFGGYTVASITIMEVVTGLHKKGMTARMQQFLSSLAGIEVLPMNTEAAVLAGRIFADLERAGQTIGRADPMIAAIAITQGLVLVTGNTNHYARVQTLGYPLRLDNWRK